jgi:hypothetical protein
MMSFQFSEDRLPYPRLWIAGGVAVALVLLLVFGSVVAGQVERSHARHQAAADLRVALDRCYEERSVAAVDRCRGFLLAGHVPAPERRLPQWPDAGEPPPVAASPAGGVVPVSLTASSLPVYVR